jgi:putative transposase
VRPAIAVSTSLTGERVVTLVEGLSKTVAAPQRIAVENSPGCISRALDAWAFQHGVQLEFS